MSLDHLAFAVTNLNLALRLFKGLGCREAGQGEGRCELIEAI